MSVTCSICGEALTSKESIAFGIGPICRAKQYAAFKHASVEPRDFKCVPVKTQTAKYPEDMLIDDSLERQLTLWGQFWKSFHDLGYTVKG